MGGNGWDTHQNPGQVEVIAIFNNVNVIHWKIKITILSMWMHIEISIFDK